MASSSLVASTMPANTSPTSPANKPTRQTPAIGSSLVDLGKIAPASTAIGRSPSLQALTIQGSPSPLTGSFEFGMGGSDPVPTTTPPPTPPPAPPPSPSSPPKQKLEEWEVIPVESPVRIPSEPGWEFVSAETKAP